MSQLSATLYATAVMRDLLLVDAPSELERSKGNVYIILDAKTNIPIKSPYFGGILTVATYKTATILLNKAKESIYYKDVELIIHKIVKIESFPADPVTDEHQ